MSDRRSILSLTSLREVLLFVAVGLTAPVMASVIISFGFVTNYTHGTFNMSGLHAQYDVGIYRYRVLGKWLIDSIYRWFVEDPSAAWVLLDNPLGYPAAKLEPTADPKLYASFFVLNTIFMVLFCSTAYLGFRTRSYRLGTVDASIRALFLMLLAQAALYVVTFYDTPVYFLMALAWVIALKMERYAPWLLVPVVVVATLFRESSLLIVALYAAFLAAQQSNWKRWLSSVAPPAIAFAMTYLWLRHRYGWARGVLEVSKEDPGRSGFALLFCLGFAAPALLSGSRTYSRFVFWYLLFSAPYLYALARGGILTEVRLFVPLLIAFFLAAGVRPLSDEPASS